MTLPVLTAVTDTTWESDLVAKLDQGAHGVEVVRRCVDVADLLAAAAAGTARAVVLSADLRRLDRDVLNRLGVVGVAVVGLVDPDDSEAERRLRQLGVVHLLAADSSASTVADIVQDAVAALAMGGTVAGWADPQAALPRLAEPPEPPPAPPGRGRVVAVWGPAGAPGRTTVAVTLADESARLELPALLVDADVYGGVCAQVLGMLDEAPGLAAACRLDGNGRLDLASLAGLSRAIGPWLRVLCGISRADRWPELRPDAITTVLDLARRLAAVTVVDCGFSLEQDEELAYDTLAPRRNGATLAVLDSADLVLVVGRADPVGVQRLIRGLAELREAVPGKPVRVMVNRVRKGAVRGEPRTALADTLARHAGVHDVVFLPEDRSAADAALAAGRTLAEVAASSSLRQALAAEARWLAGVSPRGRRHQKARRAS